jgi:hypothetical protein
MNSASSHDGIGSMFELVERAKKWFASAPVERKVADMLATGGIENDRFASRVCGETFESGTTYFGVRLSGLQLVNARELFTQQLPLCVCLTEFMNGGQRRTVPFSIGPDVIRQKMKAAGATDAAKPAWVELRDLTVVRPTPVNDTNLSLYTGLFSVPGDDFVKTLLNVVGTVGTALGQPAVGAGLKVAETIYDSFGSLLGFNQVKQVIAALIGNALTDTGSGYLLIANVAPEAFDLKRGRVVNGRLCWPGDVKQGQPVVEFDHALLALERFETAIEKGTGLASALFEEPWVAVRRAGNEKAANEALDNLRDAISASPDITESDRLTLLPAYATAAEKLIAARWPAKSADNRPKRGGGAAETVVEKLSMAAANLGDKGELGKIGGRLNDLSVALNSYVVGDVETDATEQTEKDEAAILGVAGAVRAKLLATGGLANAALDNRFVAAAMKTDPLVA